MGNLCSKAKEVHTSSRQQLKLTVLNYMPKKYSNKRSHIVDCYKYITDDTLVGEATLLSFLCSRVSNKLSTSISSRSGFSAQKSTQWKPLYFFSQSIIRLCGSLNHMFQHYVHRWSSSQQEKLGNWILTIYTSLKHYASILTQGHYDKFQIWRSQKQGNKCTWHRRYLCPCLSHEQITT